MLSYNEFIKLIWNHPSLRHLQAIDYSYVIESPLIVGALDTEVQIQIKIMPLISLLSKTQLPATTITKTLAINPQGVDPLVYQHWSIFLQQLVGKTYGLNLYQTGYDFFDLFSSLTAAFKGDKCFKEVIRLNEKFNKKKIQIPKIHLVHEIQHFIEVNPPVKRTSLNFRFTEPSFLSEIFPRLDCDEVINNATNIRSFHFENFYLEVMEKLNLILKNCNPETTLWDEF